jgi:hypothetical protein
MASLAVFIGEQVEKNDQMPSALKIKIPGMSSFPRAKHQLKAVVIACGLIGVLPRRFA